MKDYTIDVAQVEEWQTLNNTDELERMFDRSKSAIVNGAKVVFVRKTGNGRAEKFDEMDNLEDLENYRTRVFKYLLK